MLSLSIFLQLIASMERCRSEPAKNVVEVVQGGSIRNHGCWKFLERNLTSTENRNDGYRIQMDINNTNEV